MTENIQRNYEDEFLLRADNGFIHIKFETVFGFPDKTSHWGGYDTKSIIEIVTGSYSAKGQLYISTGNFYDFFVKLKECYQKLTGEATLESYEKNLKLNIVFDGLGHARIVGTYQEYYHDKNKLEFDLKSDQTYLYQSVAMLEYVYDKYGDNKGILAKP